MEAEFVNVYIGKMKEMIDDLVSRNLILDSRLSISEKKVDELNKELTATLKTIEKLNTQQKKSKKTDEQF